MFEGFDEADLLALIEDELEPERAAEIRRRLADDPKVLALVERLRSDRDLLQSTAPPPVPADLLSELEPLLARPMLMPQSTDWRRRYRKRRPWKAFVAAGLALGLLAGVWGTFVLVTSRQGADPVRLADAVTPIGDAVEGPASIDANPTAQDDSPPPGGIVHHHAPMPGPAETIAATGRRHPPGPRPRGETPALQSAEFVLVVRSDDESKVQQSLRRVLSDLETRAALVRNFSYEEAERLLERERLANRPVDRELEQAFNDLASIGATGGERPGRERQARRRKVAERIARHMVESDQAVSGQLLGPRTLAPTYERQIEFSESGAAWTISIPADRLNEVLARLQLDEGYATSLQVTRGDPGGFDSGVDRWLSDYPLARRAAAELAEDEIVLLPVVVE